MSINQMQPPPLNQVQPPPSQPLLPGAAPPTFRRKYKNWKNRFFINWRKKYGVNYLNMFYTSIFYTFLIGGVYAFGTYISFFRGEDKIQPEWDTKEAADARLRQKIENLQAQIERDRRERENRREDRRSAMM